MRILQINDLAGVAGCLAKYLRKAGHQADCISFMDDREFGFSDFYGYRRFQNQTIFRAFLREAMPGYDIIHVHFSFEALDWLYENTDRPIVMHYHGSELALNEEARFLDHRCKAIIVAGEQLLQYHPRAQYLPTIVDTEHFRPMPELRKGGYFTFKVPYLKQVQLAGNVQLEALERAYSVKDMPELLNKYDGYIDVRHHKERGLLTDLSKTGLEALACGLKVYCNDKWYTELPERHKPENVVAKLVKIYEGILN